VGFRFFMIKMRNNFAQNKQDFFGEKNRIRDWGLGILLFQFVYDKIFGL
jgi:hypothetical protein